MADVMDLDLSLEDIAKKNRSSTTNKRGRGRGGAMRDGNGGGRAASSLKAPATRSAPYTREPRVSEREREPRGTPSDGKWGHSGYIEQNNIKGGNLAARMEAKRTPGGVDSEGGGSRKKVTINSGLMSRAMADATGSGAERARGSGGGGGAPISVKGASGANVEVRNLVPGTTAEDVQAIFSDSGTITSATDVSTSSDSVTVRIRFANLSDAESARKTFDGQVADGRKLSVVIVGGGLKGAALANGIKPDLLRSGGDLLPDSGPSSGGGGMRSDALLNDARAQVLTAPRISGAAKRGGRR